MTQRKPQEELVRPRRVLGMALRTNLSCPLCRERRLRVVAFRRKVARMECRLCELRFSVDIVEFAQTLVKKSDLVLAGNPEGWAMVTVMAGWEPNEDGLAKCREIIEEEGTGAFLAHLQANGLLNAYLERLEATVS